MHRCIHAVSHLIEDHAKLAGVPIRFAATKIIEGDALILEQLHLDENEKEAIEHLIVQMEKERGLDEVLQLRICDLHLLRKYARAPW